MLIEELFATEFANVNQMCKRHPPPLNSVLTRKQIDSRHEISELLLKLYEVNANLVINKLKSAIRISKDCSYWHDFSYLVGAAFSLWRAAFLTDVQDTRPSEDVSDSIHRFLHPLIRDNIINFSQDRESSHWSVGYYLNNAMFRIGAIAKRKPEILDLKTFEEPMKLGVHNTNAQELWGLCFQSLQTVSDVVIRELIAELNSVQQV